MATRKSLRVPTPRALRALRQAARAAEDWPVAGSAMRGFHNAEHWAMGELKLRLDQIDRAETGDPPSAQSSDGLAGPRHTMARLLAEARGVDPDAARIRLYRQTLARLVPDQVAMLALLAERGSAPLCHVVAGRLPAGPANAVVLSNATSLGRDAGVLLREYVPQYMGELLALGVVESGPEDERLADQYELLMADTRLRQTLERVRRDMRMYPRLQRFSVRMSDYGNALWRDCGPPAALADPDPPL